MSLDTGHIWKIAAFENTSIHRHEPYTNVHEVPDMFGIQYRTIYIRVSLFHASLNGDPSGFFSKIHANNMDTFLGLVPSAGEYGAL